MSKKETEFDRIERMNKRKREEEIIRKKNSEDVDEKKKKPAKSQTRHMKKIYEYDEDMYE